MTKTCHVAALAALASAAAGCLPSTPGDLSSGQFTYFCADDTDMACRNDVFSASTVPSDIAVGASFELSFDHAPRLFGKDPPPIRGLEPASAAMLVPHVAKNGDAFGFSFAAPGAAAVLARSSDLSIDDFIHLRGVALDHVEVQDDLGLSVGTSLSITGLPVTVTAMPKGALEQPLAGALAYTWTSSDESVLTIQDQLSFTGEPRSNVVSLHPQKDGTAQVTVAVQDKKQTFDVVVSLGGAP
jgi:hypothetical protein